MNIGRKYIIIFGALILLVVIIAGGMTYYKEKEGLEENNPEAAILSEEETVFNFYQNYPTNLEETRSFINLCNSGIFSNAAELKDLKIKQIACTLAKAKKQEENDSDSYLLAFMPLENVSSFKAEKYLGISVDLNDVLTEYDQLLLEEQELYFCSISEPSWADPFSSEAKNPKQTLIFNEGDVSCFSAIKDLSITENFYMYFYFYGFVPQADSLSIQQYLVDKQTVSDVMNKQSFSEIKKILEDYPIVWQIEEPITN